MSPPTLLWRNFGSIWLAVFFCYFSTAPLRSYHSYSIRFRARLWLGHYNIFILFSFHTLCCRFAAVFGIIVLLTTEFQSSISCWTENLTFDSRILWYTERFIADSVTASSNHHPSNTMLDSWYEVFLLCLIWSQMMCSLSPANFRNKLYFFSLSKCAVMNLDI